MDNQDNNNNNSLQYKEHSLFFDKFYEYKAMINEMLVAARIDKNKVQGLAIAVYNVISWSSGQIEKVTNLDDVFERFEKIENKLKTDKPKAYKELEKLARDINTYLSAAELIPKVEVIEKDEELSNLDDKTRAALEAWKLVYAQK